MIQAMPIKFAVKIIQLKVKIWPLPVQWPWPSFKVTSVSQTRLVFNLQYLGAYLTVDLCMTLNMTFFSSFFECYEHAAAAWNCSLRPAKSTSCISIMKAACVFQAILCTRGVGERARDAAYNLIVEIADTMMRWNPHAPEQGTQAPDCSHICPKFHMIKGHRHQVIDARFPGSISVLLSPWKLIFQSNVIQVLSFRPQVLSDCQEVLSMVVSSFKVHLWAAFPSQSSEQQYFVNGQLCFCCSVANHNVTLKQTIHPPCCNQERPYHFRL